MNLDRFCSDRLVVLRGNASAYDAARAMFDNHVGAVLVAEQGALTGIVTDRDLALRAGRRLTLDRLPLRDVMTPNPACVEVDATLDEVVQVMLSRRARRVVVMRGGKPGGLVTLDDLILAPGARREQLRKVVRAQLSDYAPAKPEGLVRPKRLHRPSQRPQQRRAEHRAQSLHAFGAKLQRITGLAREADALAAFEVVASNVARRLQPGEAKDFVAQLPATLREKLARRPRGTARSISRDTIERDVARRLHVEPGRATDLVWSIGQHLGDLVSEGEVEDLTAQLPKKLQTLFRRAA